MLRAGDGCPASKAALTFATANSDPRTWTRAELFDAAESVASRLPIDLGPGPVAILVDSQQDQVIHYLAILASGRVPAILSAPNRKINREYYLDTIAALLRSIRFDALITDFTALADGAHVVLAPYSLALQGRRGDLPKGAEPPAGSAFMQFSSGTTGIKKGVSVNVAAVASQIEAYGRAIEISAADVVVSWLPLYHDMGFITALHLPLATGAHAVMVHPVQWVSNPKTWLELVSKYRGTLSWHPNFAYQLMADRIRNPDSFDLSSLRMLANCSEPATARAQQAFSSTFSSAGLKAGVFAGCYAMAETTFAVTHLLGTDVSGLDEVGPRDTPSVPRPVPTVGEPLPGVDLEVESADGRPAADGDLGRLIVRSPFVADGYVANTQATAEAFADGWYRTGDLGYRVGNLFYVTGREKDLMIIAGVNIHPADVEELVSQENGVQPGRVAAFSTFDDRSQTERMVVLIEPSADASEVNLQAIRSRVIAGLGVASLELNLVAPGWLVKSTSGKMARSRCRDKWLSLQR